MLQEVTDDFSEASRIRSDHWGAYYRGHFEGKQVAVWVPNHGIAEAWERTREFANRVAALDSQYVMPLLGVHKMGCEVYELMPVRDPFQLDASYNSQSHFKIGVKLILGHVYPSFVNA